MTDQEWDSLRTGDVVSNRQGTNWRVILKAQRGYIRLPSDRDRAKQGFTVYQRGDKYLFKKVPVRIKLKTMSWTITTIVPDVTRSS